jgi:hypothetical protein
VVFFTVPQHGRTGAAGWASLRPFRRGIEPQPALKASRKPIKLRGLAWDPSALLFQQQPDFGFRPEFDLQIQQDFKFNKTWICH